MKKFIMLYHAGTADFKRWSKSTSEEKKKGMAEWHAWKKKLGKKLITFGAPLGKGAVVSKKSSKPGTKSLCGYSFIKAKDLAEAKKISKAHPHVKTSVTCRIEVVEVMKM